MGGGEGKATHNGRVYVSQDPGLPSRQSELTMLVTQLSATQKFQIETR